MFSAFAVIVMMLIRLVIPLALMLLVGSLVQRRMVGPQAG